MAAPTFIPGYGGHVKSGGIAGTILYMAEWDFGFEVDLLPYNTFDKTPTLSMYFKFFLAGLASGDVRLKGFWDNTASQSLTGPTLLIKPGGTPDLFLGYTDTVGYSLTGIIPKVNPRSSAEGSADFDFDYKTHSVTSYDGQS